MISWGDYDGENSSYTLENLYRSKEYGYCLVEIDGLDVPLRWMERVGAGKYKGREVWRSCTAAVPSRQQ